MSLKQHILWGKTMIEIVQPGQAGKTSYLFDMHRLRTRIFKERMNWDVDIDKNGLEIDDFDLPEAVYVLALDDEKNVIGSWRFLPKILTIPQTGN